MKNMLSVLEEINIISSAEQPPELLAASFSTAKDVLDEYYESNGIVPGANEKQFPDKQMIDPEIEAYWAKHGF